MPTLQGRSAFSSTTHNKMNSNHSTNINVGGGDKKMGLYGRTGHDYNMMRVIPGVRVVNGNLNCCKASEYALPIAQAGGYRRPKYATMNPQH